MRTLAGVSGETYAPCFICCQPCQSAHEEEIRALSAKTELELGTVRQQLQLAQGEASAAAARVESLERETRGEVDRSAQLMAKVCCSHNPRKMTHSCMVESSEPMSYLGSMGTRLMYVCCWCLSCPAGERGTRVSAAVG